MYNIICLKHGTKYGPEYVNKLKNMVKRHTTLPFDFFCFTENARGVDSDVNIQPLPMNDNLSGWWWKPYVFKEGLFLTGTVNFFIDLDMVIVNNMDKLLEYLPNAFVGLEDVGRVFGPGRTKLCSAVLKWPANSFTEVWTTFENDRTIVKQFHGDQDYLWNFYKDQIKFFPGDWIRSYKWEVRDRSELIRVNGRMTFKDIRDPRIDSNTSILAFHGSPDPHEVKDPVIVDNWK